jgi:hypothetical protein
VAENAVLRRMYGPKTEEVTGWRKLRDEEFRNLYFSPIIIRIVKSSSMRLAMHAARIVEMRNAYIIFFGKPSGNRPIGRLTRGWEG